MVKILYGVSIETSKLVSALLHDNRSQIQVHV